MLWKFLSIVFCFNDRFRYYMSIRYRPNNRSMKCQSIHIAGQKSFKKCLSVPITSNSRPPIGIGSDRLSIDLEPIVQGALHSTSTKQKRAFDTTEVPIAKYDRSSTFHFFFFWQCRFNPKPSGFHYFFEVVFRVPRPWDCPSGLHLLFFSKLFLG